MNNELREFVGYHGTSHHNAKSIEKNGFNLSPTGWLGKGVYFFQEDKELARLWAIKNNNHSRIEVLERKIKIEKNKVFDMVDILGTHNRTFHKLRLDLVNKSKEVGIRCNFDKDKLEAQIRKIETTIINNICKDSGYDVVISATFTKSGCSLDIWSVCPNGIEICVKDSKYIYKEGVIS